MKKFFSLSFLVIFLCVFTFSQSGCKKNDIEKVSKNLTSYAISANFDDEKKEISGSEKIVYRNTTNTELEFVCLHLYPRAFREDALIKPYTSLTQASCFPNGLSYGDIIILKVKVNGDVKETELVGEDEDILKIKFGFKLAKNKTVEIVIDFIITVPNSTHRFGWYSGNVNLGNWYPVVCVFKNGKFDMSPYYATGDPFCSEISNYEVEFVYSSKYLLCSTGSSQVTKNGDKNKAKITALAVRDFAICLSDKSVTMSKEVDGIVVSYVGYNDDENKKKFLSVSADAVKFFNESFGAYPYKTLTVVKTPFIYGGMEYPNLVYISDSIDDESEYIKVIVHEIAHQWWYSVVGNDEVRDAWLDESLAEYSTALFFGKYSQYGLTYDEFVNNALSSYLLYVDVIQTIRGDINTKMNLAVNEYQNDYEYSYMIYVKGVIMFDSLKSMVGEKKIVAGLKRYYSENKFKIASKKEFYSAFKSACHKDLENFFEGYLNGSAIISKIS